LVNIKINVGASQSDFNVNFKTLSSSI